jgi:hypothetical protein
MTPREPDLFEWTPPASYPESPGYKEATTSKEAAAKMKPRAGTLREQVLTALRVAWPQGLTADEVAAKIGKREFSIRPRLTELKALRAIEPRTEKGIVQRRKNESGLDAIVWVARRSYGEW